MSSRFDDHESVGYDVVVKAKWPPQAALLRLLRKLTAATVEREVAAKLAVAAADMPCGMARVVGGRAGANRRYLLAVEWVSAGRRHLRIAYRLLEVPARDCLPSCHVVELPTDASWVWRHRRLVLMDRLREMAAKRLGTDAWNVLSVARIGRSWHCALRDGRWAVIAGSQVAVLKGELPVREGPDRVAAKLLWALFGTEVAAALKEGRLPDFVWQRTLESKL